MSLMETSKKLRGDELMRRVPSRLLGVVVSSNITDSDDASYSQKCIPTAERQARGTFCMNKLYGLTALESPKGIRRTEETLSSHQ